MKKNPTLRVAAAVALLAVIVLTLVFITTGSFNLFTQVVSPFFGFLLFIELSLVCSLL